MHEPSQVFGKLLGEVTWSVDAGYGTSITMEFGQPHLDITEPVAAHNAQLPRARRALSRRTVAVTGDWHFFVMYGAWKLTTAAGCINSAAPTRDGWKPFLDDLSGQRLLSADRGPDGSVTLRFDLGGSLEILSGGDGELWSLHRWAGGGFLCQHDGTIEATP